MKSGTHSRIGRITMLSMAVYCCGWFTAFAKERVPPDIRELKPAEKNVIEKVIREQLKDPESARFEWLPLVGKQPNAYCGLVNAKNSFGGYTGRAPYLVFPVFQNGLITIAALVGMGDGNANSSKTRAVLKQCRDHNYVF